MSIANDKIVNLQDAKVLYDDLRGRIEDNSVVEVLDTPADIQSFSNAARFPMELKVAVDPVQDLHGYDHPWVGGAGKNLLIEAVQLNVSDSGTVVTSTQYPGVIVAVKQGTTYTCSKNGSQIELVVKAFFTNVPVNGSVSYNNSREVSTDVTFTAPIDGYAYLRLTAAQQTDLSYYNDCQVEIGSTATSWEPYSNICPISGWDGANVTVTGKNLLESLESGAYGIHGEPSASTIRLCSNDFIKVKPGEKYTVNASTSTKTLQCYVNGFKEIEGAYATQSGWNAMPYTFVVSDNIKYIKIMIRYSDNSDIGVSDVSNAQIELGENNTEYESFTGNNTYSISFPISAGTVYGGELTIHSDGSGEVVVDHAETTINGSSSISYLAGRFCMELPGIVPSGNFTVDEIRCNRLETVYHRSVLGNNAAAGISGAPAVTTGGWVYFGNGDTAIDGNVQSMKTWLTSNPLQVVYKLSEPVTYSLTPGQVFALLGQNNVLADCGQINYLEYVMDTVGEVIPNRFDGLEQDIVETNTYEKTISEANAIQTFEDGAEWPLGMQIAVDPVQDLHGYDHPWPAGGGKNVLPPVNPGTGSGITCTVAEDGTVTLNGTATETVTFDGDLGDFVWDGETAYWLSGCPSGGNASNGYSLRTSCGTKAYSNYDIGNGIALDSYSGSQTITGRKINFTIVIRSGTVCNNLVFKPMLNAGTSAGDYAPYSNICPISGFTGANVTVTGKNLFIRELATLQKYLDSTGKEIDNVNWYISDYIPVNGQVTISGVTAGIAPYSAWYDSSKKYISSFKQGDVTVTPPENAKYLRISFFINDSSIQIEDGSIATDYEPASTMYHIAFPTSAGTVYGGNLTVNKDGTGTLVVDKASLTIPTIESYTGTISQTTFNAVGIKPPIKPKISSDEIVATSDVVQGVPFVNRRIKAFCCYSTTPHQIYVSVDENYSVADFNSNIAGNKIIYLLEETQSYTLSAPQVLSLIGKNHVWADTGDILSLTYNSKQGIEFIREDTAGQINTVVNPVKTELADAEAAMAIVVDGDTAPKNITSGQYVFVKNHSTLATGMYHATAAIASGASITSNNVEADVDGGFNALNSNKKNVQTAVSNPTASGTATAFVSGITQNAQGVISPTRASVPTASTSVAGIVQLNNTLTSTSTTQALTAAQGKALNGKIVIHETLTGNNAITTTHTIVSASLVRTGNIVVINAIIRLTSNISAWSNFAQINGSYKPANPTRGYADKSSSLIPIYVGVAGNLQLIIGGGTSGEDIIFTTVYSLA